MDATVHVLLIFAGGDVTLMDLGYARLLRLALVIFVIGMATVAATLPRSVKADSTGTNSGPSGLDGSGVYVNCTNRFYNSTTNTFDTCRAESITTNQPDDLILVLAACTNCAQPGQTPPALDSVADQSGLSFAPRYSFAINSSLWEYYAVAPQPLTADNVSAAFSDVNGPLNFHVIAVAGVDFSSIFDQNPSLPSMTPCNPFAPQPLSCSTSFSTSGKDLVVASIAINDMPGCQTPPGFTKNPGGGWWEADYQVFPSAQSNYTFSCSSSSTEYTEPVAMAIDAITLRSSVTLYTISWQGYDWDGGNEETLTLNGQFLASLPTVDSPQNGGTWASFAVNTTVLVQGVNTLTFTHASWDCGVSDNVENFQVTNATSVVYTNSTSLPLSCAQTLSYAFNV